MPDKKKRFPGLGELTREDILRLRAAGTITAEQAKNMLAQLRGKPSIAAQLQQLMAKDIGGVPLGNIIELGGLAGLTALTGGMAAPATAAVGARALPPILRAVGKVIPKTTKGKIVAGVGAAAVGLPTALAALQGEGAEPALPPAAPPTKPGKELPPDDEARVQELLDIKDPAAIDAQLSVWRLQGNNAAVDELLRRWRAAQAPSDVAAQLEKLVGQMKPKVIDLTDEAGSVIISPFTGKAVRATLRADGSYEVMWERDIRVEGGQEVGQSMVNPTTGERRIVRFTPVKRQRDGQNVLVNPFTEEVVWAQDRPPTLTPMDGRQAWVDPDTGEVTRWEPTEEEKRLTRLQALTPLLTQLMTVFARPATRMRFATQAGQAAGATTMPGFDISSLLAGLGLSPQEVGQLGQAFGLAPTAAPTITGRMTQMFPQFTPGQPIPLGGTQITQLPRPSEIANLTPDEQEELAVIIESMTGGQQTLSDIARQVQRLRPTGAGSSLARIFTR